MPRLPRLLGLRLVAPRVSIFTNPILPLTSRLTPLPQSLSRTASYESIHSAQSRLLHQSALRSRASSPDPHDSQAAPGPNASLSQRLKHLIKAYGWYATGVYILLSLADFTVAFAAISLIGAEHVSYAVQVVKDYIASSIYSRPVMPPERDDPEPISMIGNEGFYAILILAYTVHKTLFLPVRIGLTAAVTPKLVKWLRTRGWAGGEGTMRAAREIRERVRRNSHDQI